MNGFLSSKVGYEEYLWILLWRLRPRNRRPELLNRVLIPPAGCNLLQAWIRAIHNNDEDFRPTTTPCLSLHTHTGYTCVLGQAGINPHSPMPTRQCLWSAFSRGSFPLCRSVTWKDLWVPLTDLKLSLPTASLCDSGQLTQLFWASSPHLWKRDNTYLMGHCERLELITNKTMPGPPFGSSLFPL